jgi:hypothetical protein
MQRVTFQAQMGEIPSGYEGSIVRSTGVNNPNRFPLTAAGDGDGKKIFLSLAEHRPSY